MGLYVGSFTLEKGCVAHWMVVQRECVAHWMVQCVPQHFYTCVYLFIAESAYTCLPASKSTLSMQVAPQTVHPAFEKAAAYFDVKMVHVPLDGYRLNLEAYRKVQRSKP